MSTVTGVHETHDNWTRWPIYWPAIWVGALTALALALVIGLAGTAAGAQMAHREVAQAGQVTKGASIMVVAFAVIGSFFSFVAGGWVAGKIAGILRSEPAILHGAIVWLVAVPLLMGLMGLGAGTAFGGWLGGLASQPTAAPALARDVATAGQGNVPGAPGDATPAEKDTAARVARNTALYGLTSLLIGLVGSVIGGWMASGEPMTFTYYRTRDLHRVGGTTGTRVTTTTGQENFVNR